MCSAVLGGVEVFGPRRGPARWPPYRCWGRRPTAQGWQAVDVTDFGTWRELVVCDDTWSITEAEAFVAFRARVVGAGLKRPLFVGTILPPFPELASSLGDERTWLPPEHLLALPRPCLIEQHLAGGALRLPLPGRPLPRLGARAVLATIWQTLELLASSRWPAPDQLDFELWLHADGEVEVRPRFWFRPSVDFIEDPATIVRDEGFAPLVAELEAQAQLVRTPAQHHLLAAVAQRAGTWPSAPREPASVSLGSAREVLSRYVQAHLAPVDEPRLRAPGATGVQAWALEAL